jgi:hypothetical protein
MAKGIPRLKLGKSASFVKARLKQLPQEDETWEADFRALPKPSGQSETHYLGLVVALPKGNPLVCFPLMEYTPNVNDLADLLANAMQRPMTESACRPRQILLRGNPRWEELFPHLIQLGIEISIQNELPTVEEVYEDFLRQMRRARSNPLILYTPSPTDVHKAFPAISVWVQEYGHIEIGDQEGFGFTVRALDDGGLVFEDDKPRTLAEAMSVLEDGLMNWFQKQGIGIADGLRR